MFVLHDLALKAILFANTIRHRRQKDSLKPEALITVNKNITSTDIMSMSISLKFRNLRNWFRKGVTN